MPEKKIKGINMTVKLGRLPRTYDSRIPQLRDLPSRAIIPKIPDTVNYAAKLPANLGMMLNDVLGDCTCAAVGHSEQVWTGNAQSTMITPTDAEIEQLYENACGYVPGNPSTDNGGVEQTVLGYWLTNPVDNNKLAAFIEINPNDIQEVYRCVWECGVVYIGLNVPSYMMDIPPGGTWDLNPAADNTSIGGHAVIIVGYLPNGNFILISWGQVYYMTKAFWKVNVDEAYALANSEWIESTGKTPVGLTLPELKALMSAFKYTPSLDNHRKKKHRRQIRRVKHARWQATQ